MFTKHSRILSLWQTLANNFYPERADFTVVRNLGNELADHLVDSTPIMFRRDLGNSFSAMLRSGDWFDMAVEETDHSGQEWLESRTDGLRFLIDDRKAGFVRSTKQGDHDYATFGQCVISVEMNKYRTGLLYRNWHLRDVAWFDDEAGDVCGVSRRWKPSVRDLIQYFGADKVHKRVVEKMSTKPMADCNIRHMVLPMDMYDPDLEGQYPYMSVFFDLDNDHIIEEMPINHKMYVIPRFQTIAGSPYAYSPATIIALPDARTLQAMTYTLLEAAERYARPPIIATQKVIRGDVDLSANGVTWVDKEYDERLGSALRTLPQDRGGFPIGDSQRNEIKDILSSAFYLNKISLPDMGREMTAYEVSERMKQYRRENLPLFAPLESEYNGQLCELSFDIAFSNGLLGSPADIPESLQGADVEFKFKSPLSEAEEEQRAAQFKNVAGLLAEAAAVDPGSIQHFDVDEALREAIAGIGAPAAWLRDPEEVQQRRQAEAMQQMAAMAAEAGPPPAA